MASSRRLSSTRSASAGRRSRLAAHLSTGRWRQVEVADERISRIMCATVMLSAPFPVTFVAPIAVTVTRVLVTILGEPATTTSERQVFVFTIVNAVFRLARIDITRIDIA